MDPATRQLAMAALNDTHLVKALERILAFDRACERSRRGTMQQPWPNFELACRQVLCRVNLCGYQIVIMREVDAISRVDMEIWNTCIALI